MSKIFLKTLPFFKGLNEEDVDILLIDVHVKEYAKGKTLFLLGDKATRFFVIISGWVKLYRLTSDGEESVLAIFSRGDVFGEAAIFDGATYPFCAEAAENLKILEISGELLRERAKKNPDITNRIMASMSKEMTKLQMENEHLSIMTAPQRVGCLLLQLSSSMIGKGGTFSFPYDKSLAASRLGMKPETFSRALSQLKPHGVHVKGSEIEIKSFESLISHVCSHCSSSSDECRGTREYKNCTSCDICGKNCKSQIKSI